MTEKQICPGCERRCDLSAPACGKGRNSADTNEKLIINLREINHTMHMQYEGRASQKRILIILLESGKITQKELTERLGIQPGSASEILSKLENAGLISRIQNETDRRTTDIILTASGAELASEAAEQRQNRHKEMFSCLTSEEKAEFLSLLEKINADWKKHFAKSPAHNHHGYHRKHSCHGDRHHVDVSHLSE